MSWRDQARPVIARVIAHVGTDDEKELRRALREAYPFGAREYWPYKVWLDEIRVQLGQKRSPDERREPVQQPTSCPGQMELFA